MKYSLITVMIITTGCGPHQSNGGIICCYSMVVKEVAMGYFCTYTYTLQMYNNARLVSVQYYNVCTVSSRCDTHPCIGVTHCFQACC